MATSVREKARIRDIVISHAHMDHIAGLPLYVDDLFASLDEPIRIHAAKEVVDILERDVFNWDVYPRFSELANENGPVMEYSTFSSGSPFTVKGLTLEAIEVNHKVPSCGFLVTEGNSTIGLSGDTAEMDAFWDAVNSVDNLRAVLLECAFPDELAELADLSHHLTPSRVAKELSKFTKDCPVYIVNMKPMYRDMIVEQFVRLDLDPVRILEVGRVYEW